MSAGLEAVMSGDEGFILRFPVHRACRDGDVRAMVSVLEELSNPAHLTVEDPCFGWSPIHWAAHHGQLDCVVRLVQMGCKVNSVTSRFHQTPTHSAAFGGHTHCVVWLAQAGADVNHQDLVGEAPIHKAARCGSLECIQVLLIAGAKPHLKNDRGQTAADLAHAHGFHDCFCFISNAHKTLLQLSGLHRNGNGAPCGEEALGRKRQRTPEDAALTKNLTRVSRIAGDELENMNVESMNVEDMNMEEPQAGQEKTFIILQTSKVRRSRPTVVLASPDGSHLNFVPPPTRRAAIDMCGSLHLSGSPSSCVSHRPSWWGLTGEECGDFLHYGHFHGFGDTAEELSDGGHTRTKQESAGNHQLCHGS
uniref:Ankyrin repeat domain 10a n=1 Tax=Salarias fasciatus TaxID=181472 RepID=A0A672IYG6_SALFA